MKGKAMKTFVDNLQAAMFAKKSVLCVGLDPQLKFMPPHIIEMMVKLHGKTWEALAAIYSFFNVAIIDAIAPYASAVKPQAAFYEFQHTGWRTLEETNHYAASYGLVRIKDGKRQDGGDTADAYAQVHLGEVPFFDGTTVRSPVQMDALTIGGWIGEDCVPRFVTEMKKHGTGAFVVDKTSFKPNSVIEQLVTDNGLTVWERLAHYVALWGEGTEGENGYRNLGVVMGATKKDDVPAMRKILPKAVFLGPGHGGQGASDDECATLFNDDGFGAVINDARGIIAAWQKGPFACDPINFQLAAANAAKAACDGLNAALQRAGKYPF